MRHEKTLKAVTVAVFVLGLLVIAGSSFAQNSPRWVANAPDAGFIDCAPDSTQAGAPRELKGLSMCQVSADTETKVSFWGMNGSAWVKLAPIWGHANSDTMVVVPAGSTQSFWFPSPHLKAIYLTTGIANFSGE